AGVERGIGAAPLRADAPGPRTEIDVRRAAGGVGRAAEALAVAAGEARAGRADAPQHAIRVLRAGRAGDGRLVVTDAVPLIAAVGSVVEGRAARVRGAAARGGEEGLALADHHVVGRIVRRAVVVQHQPRADLVGTAVAVDRADRGAERLVAAAGLLEGLIEAGAAQAVSVAGAGLPHDRAAARRLADGQRGARAEGNAPLPRWAGALVRAGGAPGLRDRCTQPDLGGRPARRRRVLEADRGGRTIRVVAAHRGAEQVRRSSRGIGAGDAERVVPALHPRAAVRRAGLAERLRPRGGWHAGQLEGVAAREQRSDDADMTVVAERVGPR